MFLGFPWSPLHLKTEISDDEPCFENVFPDAFGFMFIFHFHYVHFFRDSFIQKQRCHC